MSGGLAQRGTDLSEVLPDELYNITASTGEVIKVIELEQSLGRIEHAMIKTEDQILAFGGRDSNDNVPSKIEEFNTTTNSWHDLNQELHSTNTSELVVTPFPVSSLDCVAPCQCGIANSAARIFGGNEAEVRITSSLHQVKPCFRLILTRGLLRFYVMRTLYLTTSIRSVQLCW